MMYYDYVDEDDGGYEFEDRDFAMAVDDSGSDSFEPVKKPSAKMSKKPVLKVRTEFPETWIWTELMGVRLLCFGWDTIS